MIGYLKGKVKMGTKGWGILDVDGVGYKIYTNAHLKTDDAVEFYIHHHIREDMSDLYGFSTPDEMDFFEQLLSVSGVGPKMGLAILSIGSVEKIKQAIIKGDTTLFTTISGVGKKVAAKIIVELKGKLTSDNDSILPDEGGENRDILEALEQLGYKRIEIMPIIREMPEDLSDTQAKLTWALQRLRK